jgi:hypothetical protein
MELLWPLRRSTGDSESSWDLSTSSAGDLMPYSDTSDSQRSTTTRHFGCHFRLCYSHTICYIIIWHVLSKALCIYTSRDTGITEMDWATGSMHFEDPGVDRHHLIIQNTSSIFPSSWSHAILPSFHRSKQYVWFIVAGIPSYHLTILEPEPLLLTNSLWMPCDVLRSVDDGLSAF